jgi:hypothetical protein
VIKDWRGEQVFDEVARGLARAVDEFNQEVVSVAKEQLYPGHGLLSGTLRRSLRHAPASRQGRKIVGVMGSDVIYAGVQHRRFKYFYTGLERVKGQALEIVRRNVGGA